MHGEVALSTLFTQLAGLAGILVPALARWLLAA
jgi:hypothetical protein